MNSGIVMPRTTPPFDPSAIWDRVLRASAQLQSEIPGTTVVGGTAAALWAHHRVSNDADHVLVDLRDRFAHVLSQLEAMPGWNTARVVPPVLILGSLDGVNTGLRQLRRAAPLETAVINYGDVQIRVPTKAEMVRIKGYLVLERNHVRDYVDFMSLAMQMDDRTLAQALAPFDFLYPLSAGPPNRDCRSALHELGLALGAAHPEDMADAQWRQFDILSPQGRTWDLPTIQALGPEVGTRVLQIHDDLLDTAPGNPDSNPDCPLG